MDELIVTDEAIPTATENNEHTAKQRLNRMMNSKMCAQTNLKIGDLVYFWRDENRWERPGTIMDGNEYTITISHNGPHVTAAPTRVLKITRPNDINDEDESSSESNTKDQDYDATRDEANIENESKTKNDRGNAQSCQGIESVINPEMNQIMTRSQTKQLREQQESEAEANQWTHYYISTRNPPITTADRIKSYEMERQNWTDKNAMKVINRTEVPQEANIIGSHVVCRRKQDGTLKARIVPWGNHDLQKDYLITDAPCMSIETFRLVLSPSVE